MKNYIALLLLLLTVLNSTFAQTFEKRADGFYVDGRLANGQFEEHSESGKLISVRNYIKGIEDGISVYYFPNGAKKEERAWKTGLKHGTWVTWDQKGTRTGVANWQSDQKHGKWYIWDENGTLRYEMDYLLGERTGKWSMWDEGGNLTEEREF